MTFKLIRENKVIFLLLLLLIASLGLTGFLLKAWQESSLRLNNLSLDPVNLKKYQSHQVDDIPVNTKTPIVVFLGDSRSAAWTNPNFKNLHFINRGINGETSGQTLLRFHDHVAYLKPDVIIIQVGVNDLRMLPLYPKTRQDIIKDCKNNIQQIVQKAQGLDSTVILTTIFPLGEGEVPLKVKWIWANSQEIRQGIEEVNRYIHSLAKPNQVIILDANKMLEFQGKVKPIYGKDLLHINKKGYQLLNHEIENILNQLNLDSKVR